MTSVRRAGTASATGLTGLALALALGNAAAPEWVRRAGLDVWNLPSLRADAHALDQERALIQDQQEQLRREIEAADHVTARLEAGDLSLAEATDRIEPVLRGRPGFEDSARVHYQAPTVRLAVARYLVSRVERHLGADPTRKAVIAAGLEAEYALMK
jgi:hypothetical protein